MTLCGHCRLPVKVSAEEPERDIWREVTATCVCSRKAPTAFTFDPVRGRLVVDVEPEHSGQLRVG